MGGNESETTQTPQNSPQSMRVWPGLRLIRGGGRYPRRLCGRGGVEPDGVRLDNGMRLKNQEVVPATRSYLRQLPGAHPPQARRSPATSRCATCTWALTGRSELGCRLRTSDLLSGIASGLGLLFLLTFLLRETEMSPLTRARGPSLARPGEECDLSGNPRTLLFLLSDLSLTG